jgi:hypothetical protein
MNYIINPVIPQQRGFLNYLNDAAKNSTATLAAVSLLYSFGVSVNNFCNLFML